MAWGNLKLAVQRFPLPALCSLAFCLLLLADNHYVLDVEGRLLWLIPCLFFAWTATALYRESLKGAGWKRWLPDAVAGLMLAGAFLLQLSLTGFYFLLSAAVFCVFSAPFLHDASDAGDRRWWQGNRRLVERCALAILLAGILFLGVIAIVEALKQLFGLQIYAQFDEDLWIVVATLFSPLFVLGGLLRAPYPQEEVLPRWLEVLALYVLLPLVSLYGLILYAYAAKIAMLGVLPRGIVVSLVSGYALCGLLLFCLLWPWRKNYQGATIFCRVFFPSLPLALGLAFIALAQRIAQYGVTEERYAVGLGLLWLTLCGLTQLVLRPQALLRWFPCIAAVLLLMASMSPWSARALSGQSQVQRLLEMVRMAGGLQGKMFSPVPVEQRTDKVSRSLHEQLLYLTRAEHEDRLFPWLSVDTRKALTHIDNQELSDWVRADRKVTVILNSLGLENPVKVTDRSSEFHYRPVWRPAVLQLTGGGELPWFARLNLVAVSTVNAYPQQEMQIPGSTHRWQVHLDSNRQALFVRELQSQEELAFSFMDILQQGKIDASLDQSGAAFVLKGTLQGYAVHIAVQEVHGIKPLTPADKPAINEISILFFLSSL